MNPCLRRRCERRELEGSASRYLSHKQRFPLYTLGKATSATRSLLKESIPKTARLCWGKCQWYANTMNIFSQSVDSRTRTSMNRAVLPTEGSTQRSLIKDHTWSHVTSLWSYVICDQVFGFYKPKYLDFTKFVKIVKAGGCCKEIQYVFNFARD